jgi:transcriptional regulator with XRE-family HTH domain
MTEPRLIGTWVRRSRAARGLSLRALAELAGISFSYLRDIELGDRVPPLATEDAIRRALRGVKGGGDA